MGLHLLIPPHRVESHLFHCHRVVYQWCRDIGFSLLQMNYMMSITRGKNMDAIDYHSSNDRQWPGYLATYCDPDS